MYIKDSHKMAMIRGSLGELATDPAISTMAVSQVQ